MNTHCSMKMGDEENPVYRQTDREREKEREKKKKMARENTNNFPFGYLSIFFILTQITKTK